MVNRSKKFFVVAAIFGVFFGSYYFYSNQPQMAIHPYKTSRSIASSNDSQQRILDDFTDKIVNIKNKSDIEAVRAHIIKVAKENEKLFVVQVYADVAKMLPEFEGIGWRLRGLVEEHDIVHLASLRFLRGLYQNLYSSGDHTKAFFQYIIDPSPEKNNKFTKISEVQDFLYKSIRPQLAQLQNKLFYALKTRPAADFDFYFDRILVKGVSEDLTYLDAEQAKKRVIKPHFSFVLSMLSQGIGFIEYAYVYNIDDFPKVMRKALTKSAINQATNRFRVVTFSVNSLAGKETSLPYVISRKEYFDWVKSYPSLLSARFNEAVAQPILDSSYNNFKIAAQQNLKAYSCSIEYPINMASGNEPSDGYVCDGSFMKGGFEADENFVRGGSEYLVSPNLLLLNQKSELRHLLQKVKMYSQIGNEPVAIISQITGQKINVSLRNGFKYHASLTKFLPIDFNSTYKLEDGSQMQGQQVGSYSKSKQWAWNYNYGKPTGWIDPTFGGVFPDFTNQNIYHMMATVDLTPELQRVGRIFTTVPMGLPDMLNR